MSPQTPAGDSEPSVLPPAGHQLTEAHWAAAAEAVTRGGTELDRVRAVAEAIACAEHCGHRGPVLLAELLDRTAGDPEWQWDQCIGCGRRTARRGLTVLPSGEIKRIGWCDHLPCDVDRTMTDYLEVTP